MPIIDEEGYLSLGFSIVSTIFVTVSVSIGLGLLAIPVELVDCGLWPFLVISIIPYFMESIVILLFIELIQYVQAVKKKEKKMRKELAKKRLSKPEKKDDVKNDFPNFNKNDYDDDLPSSTSNDGFYSEEVIEITENFSPKKKKEEKQLLIEKKIEPINETKDEEENENGEEDEVEKTKKELDSFIISDGIDMHTIGHFYFNRCFSIFFDMSFFAAHISVLVMLGLVGPQSFMLALLNEDSQLSKLLTFPYCFSLFILTIFFHRYIESVISFLVFIKVVFFIVPLLLGMYIAMLIKNNPLTSNPLYLSRPFFVFGSMIHGLVSFLPFMYSKVKPVEKNIRWFAYSAIIGLGVCCLITITWCVVIVMVVPQSEGKVNLRDALKRGQVSTSPYTEFIKLHFPDYTWVTRVINIFVTISITVSLIACIASLKHFMDGYLKELKDILAIVVRKVDNFQEDDQRKHVRFARYLRRIIKNPILVAAVIINIAFFFSFYIPSQVLVGSYEVIVESVGFTGNMSYYCIFIFSMLFLETLRRKNDQANDVKIKWKVFGKKNHYAFLFGSFFYFLMCMSYGLLYTFFRTIFASSGWEMPF